jgi:dipeptide/tripeptide permease
MAEQAARGSLKDQMVGLDNRFWIVNVMEMFERLAYYGVRAVVAIYMVLPQSQGGPEFTHVEKGAIFAWWAGVQSVLPMFTGGFADRYGHKKTISFAIVLKVIGYALMAYRMDYWGFFFGAMMLAAGTAVFKPGVQGTLAATLKESNASVGWGVFYQLVNIGGFLGPVIAGYLRILDWSYVFLACAAIVCVNFLWLPFYQDPTQEEGFEGKGEKGAESWAALSRVVPRIDGIVWTALLCLTAPYLLYRDIVKAETFDLKVETVAAVLCAFAFLAHTLLRERFDAGGTDPMTVLVVSVVGLFQRRVLAFCLVFSGFWLMFNQVFDLLPNVIDDWVDSSGLIAAAGAAFSTPVVPGLLATVLGLLIGLVPAVMVLLAMRPDHRPATEVPWNAYIVVGVGVAMASFTALGVFLGGTSLFAAGVVFGSALAGAAFAMRLPARIVAGLTAVLGIAGGIPAVYKAMMASSEELVAMAAAGAQVPPEWMINLNPGLIVATMVFFAFITSFVRPITSIIIGMAVATAGSIVAGTATVGIMCLAGIAIFSIGEMLSSPKKMEYLATLAKKGQEGLFMGYANIPVAIGWIAGSYLAGDAYEKGGDKANLARRYLVEELNMDEAAAAAIDRADTVSTLSAQLGKTALETQKVLYAHYSPESVWWSIGAIGLGSIVAMVIYDRVISYIDRDKG